MFSFRQASLGYLFLKKTKPDIKMSGKIRIRLGDLLLKLASVSPRDYSEN